MQYVFFKVTNIVKLPRKLRIGKCENNGFLCCGKTKVLWVDSIQEASTDF